MGSSRSAAVLILLALFAPSARAEEADAVDLSETFPDAACRSQGNTGACHAFGSIALLESAIYRRYGLIGGIKLKLSEADLFVSMAIAKLDFFEGVWERFRADPRSPIWVASLYFKEGGNPYEDLKFAQRNGVATDRILPWDKFKERYDVYRNQREGQISAVSMQCAESFREADSLEKAGERAQCLRIKRGAKDKFGDFMDSLRDQNCKEAEACLLGADPAIQKERENVRKLIEDFTLKRNNYRLLYLPERDDEALCRKAGRDRRGALLKSLRKGIPVLASINVAGLAEWGGVDLKVRRHALTVVGFELVGPKKERAIFKSRNSSSGINPDVPEEQLCRVMSLTYVFTDQEVIPRQSASGD